MASKQGEKGRGLVAVGSGTDSIVCMMGRRMKFEVVVLISACRGKIK